MVQIRLFVIVLLAGSLIGFGCNEAGNAPKNPFDQTKGDTTIVAPPPDVDPNSIVGLHYNIFSPTCANSGCHDGTFEPDFRTVESTYNTLVLHPIIKNDPQGSYSVRVNPGAPASSVLWNRLNVDIDGQSGIMPLAIDPDGDWNEKREQYLSNVKTWIEQGARDMFGNPPVQGTIQPSMRGLIAFANGGNTVLGRDAGSGPIVVPPGVQSLEIWISLADDVTDPKDLEYNKAKFSVELNGFEGQTEKALQITNPITELGFFGDPVPYYHTITIDPRAYSAGTRLFMRVYVKDPQLSSPTEIPANGSADYTKDYFSFEIE